MATLVYLVCLVLVFVTIHRDTGGKIASAILWAQRFGRWLAQTTVYFQHQKTRERR